MLVSKPRGRPVGRRSLRLALPSRICESISFTLAAPLLPGSTPLNLRAVAAVAAAPRVFDPPGD